MDKLNFPIKVWIKVSSDLGYMVHDLHFSKDVIVDGFLSHILVHIVD